MAEPVASLPPPQTSTSPIAWPQNAEELPFEKGASKLEEAVEESRVRLERTWQGIQRSMWSMASRAAQRIRYLKRERPLEVIAGVAAAAFVLGAALRTWRSRHE